VLPGVCAARYPSLRLNAPHFAWRAIDSKELGMSGTLLERRRFLEGLGAAGFACALESAFSNQAHGSIVHEVASGAQVAATVPRDRIKFGVCGISHDHIIGMTNAIKRGGGTLTKVWARNPTRSLRSRGASPRRPSSRPSRR
jgi:hypothetical protein